MDRLETAIVERTRIRLVRRGTEYIVMPYTIGSGEGTEVLVARHPNTGDEMRFALDELDAFEVLR